jgi:ribonuclease G
MRREILIDGATRETRVALLEDEVLTEVFVERRSGRGIAGNIYKGRVSHVLPGMQAAFVDIGTGRDAFLYVRDLTGGIEDDDLPVSGDGERTEDALREHPAPPRIEDLLKEGQDILVQVAKDPVPEKGARLTSLVSLPGRFLVYLPTLAHIGVSRRIEDPPERERLKELARDVARDQHLTGGFIVRTAGAGRSHGEFAPDARILATIWEGVRGRAESTPAPSLLHQEAGAVAKLLRDVLGEDVHRLLVDGETAYEETLELVRRTEPALADRVRRHAGAKPLFETRGIDPQLERALRSRLWLKSGGSIVIQATEALVAIDVNTGKYVGTRRLEETVLRTNVEAAVEIVRQIRLRDLGGIIVIDFIDMEEQASKDRVLSALQAELRRDRSKSRVLGLSEFGLVEITRQRTKPSLERLLCRPCPVCAGSGRLKTTESLVYEILREIQRLGPLDAGTCVVAHVHPEVAASLGPQHAELKDAVACLAPARLEIAADAALRHEQFSLTVRVPEGV